MDDPPRALPADQHRIDKGLVVTRAKARSAQDGFMWYLDEPSGNGSRPLSEARRRLYLAKARAELISEAGHKKRGA